MSATFETAHEHGPLTQLDLNESDSFLHPSTTPKQYSLNLNGMNKVTHSWDSKDKDIHKLPVMHSGAYGEQAGTLIVRHYVAKSSKCIQCRNCGIFFTTSSFLQHCHDQYGKRIQCNGVQLQLGLGSPTSKQLQIWDEFQKKMHSGFQDGYTPSVNERLFSDQANATDRDRFQQGPKHGGPDTKASNTVSQARNRSLYTSGRTSNLYSSKKYASTPMLNTSESLSAAGLNRIESTPSYCGTDVCQDSRPFQGHRMSEELPTRSSWMTSVTSPNHSYYASRSGWGVTHSLGDRNTGSARPAESLSALRRNERNLLMVDITPRVDLSASNSAISNSLPQTMSSAVQHPKDLIIQACTLLQQAKTQLSEDKGRGSNAWRKMYEEERCHRMALEAKVRDLEREIRMKSVA